jgi:uncharacterized protein
VNAAQPAAVLALRVTPRAARNAIVRGADGAWTVRLQAPPVEGKANAALLRYLADALGVRPRCITLAAGKTARVKRVRVAGLTAAEADARLSTQTCAGRSPS